LAKNFVLILDISNDI